MKKIKLIIISAFFAALINTVYCASLKNVKFDLYSIEKDGKQSYIVGTCHNVPLKSVKKEIKKTLVSQDYLVVEHDNNTVNPNFRRGKNDPSWWNKLSKKEQKICSKHFNNKDIKNYKLNIILLHLIHQYTDQIVGNKENEGIDEDLENLYPKEKVFYLESLDELLESISKSSELNDINSLKDLLASLHEMQTNPGLKKELLKEFKEELKPSKKKIKKSKKTKKKNSKKKSKTKKSEEEFKSVLITGRNLLWIDRIEKFHKTLNGKVLFAFGSAHLDGNQGVLKLLKDRNYQVNKMKF